MRTSLLLIMMLCGGCAIGGHLGVPPYAVGAEARCESPDGCLIGVEAGGWRAGVAVFPDIGPMEDEHEETHPAGVGQSGS